MIHGCPSCLPTKQTPDSAAVVPITHFGTGLWRAFHTSNTLLASECCKCEILELREANYSAVQIHHITPVHLALKFS